MKLTFKKIRIVSFIVLLSCLNWGCQFKGNQTDSNIEAISESTDPSSSSTQDNNQEVKQENSVVSMAVGENPVVREYILYAMNTGEISSTKTVQKRFNQNVNLNKLYQELLQELSEYIGYDITMNSISVSSEEVHIDFNEESDIFHKEKYNAARVQPVKYSNYEDMAFGILDSVNTTIKKNQGEDVLVYYTEDGEQLTLPEITKEVEFIMDEPYQGSKYYEEQFLSRAEGSITDLVDLGMTYNEVLIRLNENDIDTIQTEDFSKLGDQTNWEFFYDLDEYLSNAWVHIMLESKEYEFLFDGADTTLMEVRIVGHNMPSTRGLYVGDSMKRLVELYGEDYTMYVIEGSLLYEYQLKDCYFRVSVDAAQEYIKSYGISSYSQADVIRGEQIMDQIRYQQELRESLELNDGIGI